MNASASSPTSDANIARWLAFALVALPFLQALPIDFDRTGPLFLLTPALWLGRNQLCAALQRLRASARVERLALAVGGSAVVVSTFTADQFAPATVAAATWVLLAGTALIAGEISRDPLARSRLLGGFAVGAAAAIVTVWALWLLGGRGAMPLYAHHRHLGLHALGGAVASVALLIATDASHGQRVVRFAIAVVCWGGLFWSGSRGPVLALAAALVVWFAVRRPERSALLRAVGLLLPLGLALSAAFWTSRPELGWWHALDRTASATTGATRNGTLSGLTSTRSEFWRDTVQRALDAPWLGHGPDAYRFLTPKLDGQQPHNVVLQAWLDLGLLGALPWLFLLGWTIVRGWCRAASETDCGSLAPWLAVASASTLAGLLDGVFYHLVALLPAALAIGVAFLSVLPPAPEREQPAGAILATGTIATAVAVLALHAGIFHALVIAPPPRPDSGAARLVRAFPSTTFGLWHWLDRWQTTQPDIALDWARWAQTRSANPPMFHVYAARLLLARGEGAAAETELLAARAKAHWTTRPTIDAMLREIRPAP